MYYNLEKKFNTFKRTTLPLRSFSFRILIETACHTLITQDIPPYHRDIEPPPLRQSVSQISPRLNGHAKILDVFVLPSNKRHIIKKIASNLPRWIPRLKLLLNFSCLGGELDMGCQNVSLNIAKYVKNSQYF